VNKQARVKEEVVVKKDAEQRTEKVSDKVRHTEVKVEDERGNAVQPGKQKAG
jgi:stress response protein YsnF